MALPLEAINAASAREKSIRHGHPSTLHLWWARRPLAACRAVLFASIVDDPSSRPEEFPTEEAQEAERKRLFGIIERLVQWENTNNEAVLNEARQEILKSTDGHPPPVLDPFCGGGSIPLEAQRLGLEAHASDLNPVAVLITKALIEIPPKFAGMPPVNPESRKKSQTTLKGAKEWKGAEGLAEDVRYYGKWMRDEAEKRIGHLYPKAKLPNGTEATVIAWLWARTVRCPNPACGAMMPLVRSFELSTKKSRKAWVEPIIDTYTKQIRFEVKTGNGLTPNSPKVGRGAKFRCLVCGQIAEDQHIKDESTAGRMDSKLMTIVAKGKKGRVYLSPDKSHEVINVDVPNDSVPTQPLAYDPRNIWCVSYGLNTFNKLFSKRQLVALTTFSDLVIETRELIIHDAIAVGLPNDNIGISICGKGAQAYADAVATYLALAVDKGANYWSSLCAWHNSRDIIMSTFARQALPMVWDFVEANPFSNSSGNFLSGIDQSVESLENSPADIDAFADQNDAIKKRDLRTRMLFCTDPPYYDNIAYSDLSDFFYVWLRRTLNQVHSDIFSTILTPKDQELVVTPYRFNGDKALAQKFFEEGLIKTFEQMRCNHHQEYPLTVFYAFKQTEESGKSDHIDSISNHATDFFSRSSTGWDTMLTGLIHSGFSITGTWPMRTELTTSLKKNVSALASSILIVCRPPP